METYTAEGLKKAERVKRFAAEHVIHTKDRWAGKPFILEPWQYDHLVKPVYGQLDKDGKRTIKRALFGVPRWSGKSMTTAMLHMYHLFAEPVYGGEQYAFATTRQQAAIIFDAVKRMINADPLLRSMCTIYRNSIEVIETGCTFRALPFDADTSQGYHPSFASGDEIHVMKDLSMVEAMVTGMVGREQGLFVAITTAADRQDTALDELRALWEKDPAAHIYWQGASPDDDLTDPKVWRKANPASWITMDMLKSQYQALPLPVFARLHLNLTPQGGDSARAYNRTAWDLCSDPPNINDEDPCIIGVDAAPRRDKTAVVLDQRHQDGTHHVKCWGFEADPEAGLLDFDELTYLLRELCSTYNVARIVVDPAHLFAIMDQLQREGLPVEDYPQTASRMIPASMNLYDLIQLGRIRHGDDPMLTEHVLNAGVKEIPPSGWRITKVSRFENIDAAVALAMAARIAEAEASMGAEPVAIVV